MSEKEVLLSNHQPILSTTFSLDGSRPMYTTPVVRDDVMQVHTQNGDFVIRNTQIVTPDLVEKIIVIEPMLFPEASPNPLDFRGGHNIVLLTNEKGDRIYDYNLQILPSIIMDKKTQDGIVRMPSKARGDIVMAIHNFSPICFFVPDEHLTMTSKASENVAWFGIFKDAPFIPPFGKTDEENNGKWQDEQGILVHLDLKSSPNLYEVQYVHFKTGKTFLITPGLRFYTHDFDKLNAILHAYVMEKDFNKKYLDDIVYPYCKVEIL